MLLESLTNLKNFGLFENWQKPSRLNSPNMTVGGNLVHIIWHPARKNLFWSKAVGYRRFTSVIFVEKISNISYDSYFSEIPVSSIWYSQYRILSGHQKPRWEFLKFLKNQIFHQKVKDILRVRQPCLAKAENRIKLPSQNFL